MKKHALVITLENKSGGVQRRLLRVYQQIAQHRDGICLIMRKADDIDADSFFSFLKIDTSAFSSIQVVNTRFALVRACLKGKFSTIHFAGFGITIAGISLLGKLQGLKTIVSIENTYAAQDVLHGAARRISHITWKLADHIDLLYPFWKNSVLKYKSENNVTCTPGTFTDLRLFSPKHKEKLLVFCAARLDKIKGGQFLVPATIQIADILRDKGYKVILAGKGYQEEVLRKEIMDNKVDDVIQMVGYVAPQEYLPCAEVAFSLQESNYPSQVVAEAAASGCCLIATRDEENVPEFLNETFTLFCDRNADSLAEVMLRYINLEDEQKWELHKNARVHAEKFFNIQTSVAYFEDIIRQLSV